jgi:hypothetical protein
VRPALAAAGYRAVSPFARGYHPTPVPQPGAYDIETLGRDALALIMRGGHFLHREHPGRFQQELPRVLPRG